MGMFDYVHVDDERFVCSEGHALSGEEFQTKDFACVLGDVFIKNGAVTFHGTYLGPVAATPFTGRVWIGASCPKCPCFVQAITGNLVATECGFDLVIEADRVVSVTMESETTAEFLAREPTEKWMAGCHGPMTTADAEVMQRTMGRRTLTAAERAARS